MRRMYSKPQLLEAVEQESKVNGIKVFENIVDKDGHNRFIEGDIPIASGFPETSELKYGKWALSGTHLLLVFAFSGKEDDTYTAGTYLYSVQLPKWIMDKIYPVWGDSLERKQLSMVAEDWSSQAIDVVLRKHTTTNLGLYMANSLTLTKDRNVRIAFDLLIDNE